MNANIRIFINIKSASGEIDHLLDVAVVVLLTNKGKKTSVGLVLISIQNLQCGGRERRWFGDAAGWGVRGWGVTRAAVVRGGLETRGDGLSAGCGGGSETRRAGARGAGA